MFMVILKASEAFWNGLFFICLSHKYLFYMIRQVVLITWLKTLSKIYKCKGRYNKKKTESGK